MQETQLPWTNKFDVQAFIGDVAVSTVTPAPMTEEVESKESDTDSVIYQENTAFAFAISMTHNEKLSCTNKRQWQLALQNTMMTADQLKKCSFYMVMC